VPRIVQACKKYNIICILQCAHAIGSVELKLHEWQVDCAVWCTYKYLNCCQGTVGGLFVHENHKDIEPGLKGWFGVDKSAIFNFSPVFLKKPGA
jgi:kynureninase